MPRRTKAIHRADRRREPKESLRKRPQRTPTFGQGEAREASSWTWIRFLLEETWVDRGRDGATSRRVPYRHGREPLQRQILTVMSDHRQVLGAMTAIPPGIDADVRSSWRDAEGSPERTPPIPTTGTTTARRTTGTVGLGRSCRQGGGVAAPGRRSRGAEEVNGLHQSRSIAIRFKPNDFVVADRRDRPRCHSTTTQAYTTLYE